MMNQMSGKKRGMDHSSKKSSSSYSKSASSGNSNIHRDGRAEAKMYLKSKRA